MEWLEASIITTSDGVEIVCAVLMENGITGMQIEDEYDMSMFLENNTAHWDYADEELLNKEKGTASVIFYIASGGNADETIYLIQNKLDALKTSELDYGADSGLGELKLEVRNVDDKDWLDNWKKYYKPFRIGQKVIIKPIWEDACEIKREGDIVFEINPGHVFGTGLHQSTQMCVESLEKYISGEERVIDIGCGSGILSIISILLGAENALAVDTDCTCAEIAQENAELNHIEKSKYTAVSGNILTDKELLNRIANIPNKYDVVLANIIADIIINLSPIVPGLIKHGGIFISSGIIKERISEVMDALESNSFDVIEIREADEWRSITAVYKG